MLPAGQLAQGGWKPPPALQKDTAPAQLREAETGRARGAEPGLLGLAARPGRSLEQAQGVAIGTALRCQEAERRQGNRHFRQSASEASSWERRSPPLRGSGASPWKPRPARTGGRGVLSDRKRKLAPPHPARAGGLCFP